MGFGFYVVYGFAYSIDDDRIRQILFKKCSEKINMIFGYRTSMSMKNMDTWIFAHKYFGRLWYIGGMVLLPISLVVMLLAIGKTEDMIGTVGGALCGVQMIPLIGAIIPTERALRKTFDKDGERDEAYTSDP